MNVNFISFLNDVIKNKNPENSFNDLAHLPYCVVNDLTEYQQKTKMRKKNDK
jgi:hypothetical protein